MLFRSDQCHARGERCIQNRTRENDAAESADRRLGQEDDEFLAIVSSNAARVLSSDERKAIYLKLKEIYDRKCAAGEKPKGRERETIAAWMGVTDRTIQNYKKQTEGDHVQKQNNSGKILKKISGIERYFTDLETDIYTDEELEHLRQSAIPAINILMMRLNIDVRDL